MHPYTQALLSAIPSARPGMAKARILLGEMPSPLNPPSGCRFHTRCPKALPQCKTEEPMWKEIGAGHYTVPSELMANDLPWAGRVNKRRGIRTVDGGREHTREVVQHLNQEGTS